MRYKQRLEALLSTVSPFICYMGTSGCTASKCEEGEKNVCQHSNYFSFVTFCDSPYMNLGIICYNLKISDYLAKGNGGSLPPPSLSVSLSPILSLEYTGLCICLHRCMYPSCESRVLRKSFAISICCSLP